MTTFVLVPGFFLGAWAWKPVTAALRAGGHEVYPLSLTGLGERAHLSSPDVDLETHITDVLNLLYFEDLRDVTLVGHSYGGIVTTAVADRDLDRVAKLVYVDTGPLPDGAAQNDFAQAAPPADGAFLQPPDWASIAPAGVDVEPLRERAVPQPWKSAIQPVRLTGAWEKLPRLGIMSSVTIEQMSAGASSRPLMRHMAGEQWTFVELPTWHWPMIDRPDELARHLMS
jgi:pimeloyl-ACP methyl ester carboxylesterase